MEQALQLHELRFFKKGRSNLAVVERLVLTNRELLADPGSGG
jgi:hypothetical protein